jgi:PhzF family phenazine biosynthesis protein
MVQRFTQVDAFTNHPFSGNPAAVCILPRPLEEPRMQNGASMQSEASGQSEASLQSEAWMQREAWMQNVAMEMNLAETAFLTPQEDGYGLRWLTPTMEVDLCGHATLAAAHVLWEEGHLSQTATARFHTRSGLLTAVRNGEWIEMDFPAEPETETHPPPELSASLGVTPLYVGKNRMDYLVALSSEALVRALAPDHALLRKVPARGVIVTSRSDSEEYDFVSRFFAPTAGVDEDSVTGSAHCCLGPFWASRLRKAELIGYQASPRGGIVRVRMAGPRVALGGQAVTVLHGELAAIAM